MKSDPISHHGQKSTQNRRSKIKTQDSGNQEGGIKKGQV